MWNIKCEENIICEVFIAMNKIMYIIYDFNRERRINKVRDQ